MVGECSQRAQVGGALTTRPVTPRQAGRSPPGPVVSFSFSASVVTVEVDEVVHRGSFGGV